MNGPVPILVIDGGADSAEARPVGAPELVRRLRSKIDDGFPRLRLHTRWRVGYELSETP
ncbi:MAG: helix-turn-helix domain-containing protein [Steroidobacteraceae bacterium]|jgi:hypothetical protein|nr:helix-turn-helix domain-containing protein [Steroidobacteraceae bacterium]